MDVSVSEKARGAVASLVPSVSGLVFSPDITSIPITTRTTATASGVVQLDGMSYSFSGTPTQISKNGSAWVVALQVKVPKHVYSKVIEFLSATNAEVDASSSFVTSIRVSIEETNCFHTITQDISGGNTWLKLVDNVSTGCAAYQNICYKYLGQSSFSCSPGAANIALDELLANATNGLVNLTVAGSASGPSANVEVTIRAANQTSQEVHVETEGEMIFEAPSDFEIVDFPIPDTQVYLESTATPTPTPSDYPAPSSYPKSAALNSTSSFDGAFALSNFSFSMLHGLQKMWKSFSEALVPTAFAGQDVSLGYRNQILFSFDRISEAYSVINLPIPQATSIQTAYELLNTYFKTTPVGCPNNAYACAIHPRWDLQNSSAGSYWSHIEPDGPDLWRVHYLFFGRGPTMTGTSTQLIMPMTQQGRIIRRANILADATTRDNLRRYFYDVAEGTVAERNTMAAKRMKALELYMPVIDWHEQQHEIHHRLKSRMFAQLMNNPNYPSTVRADDDAEARNVLQRRTVEDIPNGRNHQIALLNQYLTNCTSRFHAQTYAATSRQGMLQRCVAGESCPNFTADGQSLEVPPMGVEETCSDYTWLVSGVPAAGL